ncbi:MAG: DUF190 domain-containing protein [Bryobacteraceae bacterium]
MDSPARLLLIYTSSSEAWGGLPLAEALVRKLCALGIEGATAHSASMGYGKHKRVRQHKATGDDEHRPVMVTAADTEAKILEAIPHLRALAPGNAMLILDAEMIPPRGGAERLTMKRELAWL